MFHFFAPNLPNENAFVKINWRDSRAFYC